MTRERFAEIVAHYYELQRMGLMNDQTVFQRVFYINPEWAVEAWGPQGVHYTEIMTACIGMDLSLRDFRLISKRVDYNRMNVGGYHQSQFITHGQTTNLTYSVSTDIKTATDLEKRLIMASRFYQSIDFGEVWFDEYANYNREKQILLKFSY